MNLEATCETCDRPFLLAQILPEPAGTSGRCPSCGARFARHYVAILPEAAKSADAAAGAFVAALQRLNDMHPGFKLDIGAILARLSDEFSPPGRASA